MCHHVCFWSLSCAEISPLRFVRIAKKSTSVFYNFTSSHDFHFHCSVCAYAYFSCCLAKFSVLFLLNVSELAFPFLLLLL